MKPIVILLLLTACASTPAQQATLPTPPPLVISPETEAQREKELAAAREAYEKDPNDAELIIWLGRRTAYLGRYKEAIDIFTEGIRKHPGDARMYRHRGHRWITLRQLDPAIDDLSQAAKLVRGKPDQIEPDGLPNARNTPTSTLQSNIWYHLGLGHYLKGDFEKALDAYRQCLKVSKNPDGVVSTSHWLYMTLRRLGRREEADKVLGPIDTAMDVIENQAYYTLLLMYGGDVAPEELILSQDPNTTDGATILYGIGNWYLCNGQPEKAKPIFEKICSARQWPAFGFIAAEFDLRRLQ